MNPSKKKILLFIDWFTPGFRGGGPIRSCFNLVGFLKDTYDFHIVTRNTDLGQNVPYADVEGDKWTDNPGGFRVFYFSNSRLSINNIRKIIKNEKYDIIYLNSFFSVYFTLTPLLVLKFLRRPMPMLLAPRGMLGTGALKIKSFKKHLFIFVAGITGFYKGITWHATTDEEKDSIVAIFGKKSRIKIAANLPAPGPMPFHQRVKNKNELSLFFLSRISPKKNLLSALAWLKNLNAGGKVRFDIIGPVDDNGYWRECLKVAEQLPAGIIFNHIGAIPPGDIPGIIRNYHFLLLPTLHENYGHVIVESLAAGCPVIISNCTPWRGLEDIHAGWDIPLQDEEKFRMVLLKCLGMDQKEFDIYSQGAFQYAMNIVRNPGVKEQNLKLFSNL
ncbi:MAG: glycosyltransferase family 4 protein [Bacteroidetes bacterium]|nr:glycosyltransferase family 4 protein [Bacteroidota bacterium]